MSGVSGARYDAEWACEVGHVSTTNDASLSDLDDFDGDITAARTCPACGGVRFLQRLENVGALPHRPSTL